MNVGLFLLWALVILALIVFVVLSVSGMKRFIDSRASTIVPGETRCVVPFDSVPDVSTLPCCFIGERLTASRYVPSLDLVVNPVAVPYLPVCEGFCRNGTEVDSTAPTRVRCVNGNGQAAFDRCVALAAPRNNCRGVAMPVAALGTTFFYPNSATAAACQDARPCSR